MSRTLHFRNESADGMVAIQKLWARSLNFIFISLRFVNDSE
jgi:hypothetical protein